MTYAPARFFFDTEFDETREPFHLDFVSIGIVSEDGASEYYGVSNEFNDAACKNPWIQKNVIAKLPPQEQRQNHEEIRDNVTSLLAVSDTIELWAYWGSYDNTSLCMLYGGMITFLNELEEKGVQKVVFRDLNELERIAKIKDVEIPEFPGGIPHIAIEDARWEREKYHQLKHLDPLTT